MNYQKIYDKIIENARIKEKNLESGYYEYHHIIPLCIGGTDNIDNLVKLTLREHYICHKLLTKIYPENKKIIHAFWMITITTMGALKSLYENNIYRTDGTIINRIKHFMYDESKLVISSRDYEYAKEAYRKMMNGHKVSEETKKLISNNTKKGMKNRDTIEKCRSGSLGCHYYRNKNTGEVHKWFPGEPDIDLNVFEWGRGPISKKQKEKLAALKSVNRYWIYNKELDIKYCVYSDYVNELDLEGWEKRNPPKPNNSLYKDFVKRISDELKRKELFDIEELLFFYMKLNSLRRIITPSIFVVCKNLLKKYRYDKSDKFIKNSTDFIVSNKEKLIELNKMYLKN